MNKSSYLDFLFYKVGRQATNFELQIQNQDGIMSHRHSYSEIGFEKNGWWLEKVNARTLLKNEVVLDFDPNPNETQEEFNERMKKIHQQVLFERCEFFGIFESNRATHIHLFYSEMFFMSDTHRIEFRKSIITKYGADLLKASDRITISCEFSPHWKSGKEKMFIRGNLLDCK